MRLQNRRLAAGGTNWSTTDWFTSAMFQMFAAAAASSSVSIPDVEPADALHAFRYAQGAHMTRLFDKLEGGLPVTVAAIGSSTTANGGAMFCSSPTVPAARGVNPDELRPAAAGASLDDEAYCSPRLCDPAYWKGWPWLVMFMCDLNQTWPHPEHLLVNLARSGTGLNLHMTTRCLHGLLPRAPLDLVIADFSTHPSTPVEMERFVRLLLSLRQPHPPVILLFHHYNFRSCMPERFDASLVNFADDSAGEVRHRFELLALPTEYGADATRRATLLKRAGSPLAEVVVKEGRGTGVGRGAASQRTRVSQEEKLLMWMAPTSTRSARLVNWRTSQTCTDTPCLSATTGWHILARRTISAACYRANRTFGARISRLRLRPRPPTASIRTTAGYACRPNFSQRGCALGHAALVCAQSPAQRDPRDPCLSRCRCSRHR